jgi:HSP20 family molecular chaperone IbpA
MSDEAPPASGRADAHHRSDGRRLRAGSLEARSEGAEAGDGPAPVEAAPRKEREMRELLEILVHDYTPVDAKIHLRRGFGWRPATDAYETEDEFVVVMDIAGMEPKNIRVKIEDQLLTISGVRDKVEAPGKKHFYKMEVPVGPFERNIRVPVPVATDKILARYGNGFLEVRLKKSRTGEAGPHVIPVE